MTEPRRPMESDGPDAEPQDELLASDADGVSDGEAPDQAPLDSTPEATLDDAGVPVATTPGTSRTRPGVPTAGPATRATPADEMPKVDDRVSKLFVAAIALTFAGILLYALLFGRSGALTPAATPRPSPSATPVVSLSPSPGVSPSASPGASPSTSPAASPSASVAPTASPGASASPAASPSPAASASPAGSPTSPSPAGS